MRSALFVCVLSAFCATARADDPGPREVTVAPIRYAFDDELVAGDYASPREILTVVRGRGKRGSLIEVRESFVRELTKSVEEL